MAPLVVNASIASMQTAAEKNRIVPSLWLLDANTGPKGVLSAADAIRTFPANSIRLFASAPRANLNAGPSPLR